MKKTILVIISGIILASPLACTSQSTDTEHMDIFDAHAHIMSKVSASQIISEMDKAGVRDLTGFINMRLGFFRSKI